MLLTMLYAEDANFPLTALPGPSHPSLEQSHTSLTLSSHTTHNPPPSSILLPHWQQRSVTGCVLYTLMVLLCTYYDGKF